MRHSTIAKFLRNRKFHSSRLWFIIVGISSLIWLIFRSGKKPSRLQYPCQKVAASNSALFLVWITSVFTGHVVYKKLRLSFTKVIIFLLLVGLVYGGIKLYNIKYLPASNPIRAQSTLDASVVWITNSSAAGSWSNNWETKAVQSVVDQMMTQALLQLTGQNSAQAAWTKIFTSRNSDNHDYRAGEKIAIKINNNNNRPNSGQTCGANNLCPLLQSLRALLKTLTAAAPGGKGIPASDIYVYDTSTGIASYQQVLQTDFPGLNFGGQDDCSEIRVDGQSLASLLSNVAYVINMPLLRTHSNAGATLSFKNHLGSTCNPGYIHDSGGGFNDNFLVDIGAHTLIKDKTVLIVDDAIYANLDTQNAPYGPPTHTTNSLFLSRDPVAIDSVMTDFLVSLGGNIQAESNPRVYLQAAYSRGLGTYETVCSGTNCNFENYTNIKLSRCNPNCPGTPSPGATATPHPSATPPLCNEKGDVNKDCRINAIDLSLVFAAWLGSGSCGGFNCNLNGNSKVNALDASIVLSTLHN